MKPKVGGGGSFPMMKGLQFVMIVAGDDWMNREQLETMLESRPRSR